MLCLPERLRQSATITSTNETATATTTGLCRDASLRVEISKRRFLRHHRYTAQEAADILSRAPRPTRSASPAASPSPARTIASRSPLRADGAPVDGEPPAHLGVAATRPRRLRVDHQPDHFVERLALGLVGTLAGEQLVEQHAQRIDIGGGGSGQAASCSGLA